MSKFTRIIQQLKKHYGEPGNPHPHGPWEWVLWENACYLLPDERRLEVFHALREQIGLNPSAIDGAPDSVLLPIAIRGGMRPGNRVFRWKEIARIALNRYGGDLNAILSLPYAEAKEALKQFPTIGEPGAEKILLFCGRASGLPLESNGLRVLSRIGWGRAQKNYGATYRSVQAALQPELPSHVERLREAHLLLRIHGKKLCKDHAPLCHQCPVSSECAFSQSRVSASSRPGT
jgi:endonuclease III